MKLFRLDQMTGGWFIGNFDPCAYKTKYFEVAYKTHLAGDEWPNHYQKKATEITMVIRGKIMLNRMLVTAGEIVLVEPGEAVKPSFLENCEIVVIKFPSLPGDKVVVE